jgi:2-amino-4-hydroxy-6-hydroxymethyldihydropteridine diphosphokinase
MSLALVSLGSNLGNRQENLDAALARLAAHPHIKILARSRWSETLAVGGPPDQGDFLNGALKIETSLPPHELLACLQGIENELGRRREQRWGPRTVDLDLLLYDDQILATPTLVLPHPRMAWRRFVLEPAAEVAGDMIHPTIGWSVAGLFENLDHSAPYVAITGPIAAGKTRLAKRLADAIPARLILERPNWSHLGAFYADPAARAWQTELAFLAEREQKVSASALAAKDESRPSCSCVSDFWFDQSAAFARAWLPPDRIAEYMAHYEQSRRAVVAPRLIVLLDAPPDELLARIHRRGRRCEHNLTVESLERIRREVLAQCNRPGLGPVLRAEGTPEAVFAEVLAAIQSMA